MSTCLTMVDDALRIYYALCVRQAAQWDEEEVRELNKLRNIGS